MRLITIIGLFASGCDEFVRWGPNGPAGPVTFDAAAFDTRIEVETLEHSALAAVQARFVARNGDFVLFDYNRLLADPESLALLDGYLTFAAQIDPLSLANPSERLALLINVYNAAVLRGVATNVLVKADYSVEDDNFIFFREPRVRVGGVTMSLDQLEHGAMRGDWARGSVASASADLLATLMSWHQAIWNGQPVDPRIHAVVNCAATSCPNLVDQPPYVIRARDLEAQLATQTTMWLDSVKGASALGISSLFDWYAEDFQMMGGTVESFIQANRTDGLSGVDTTNFLPYDWTLNLGP